MGAKTAEHNGVAKTTTLLHVLIYIYTTVATPHHHHPPSTPTPLIPPPLITRVEQVLHLAAEVGHALGELLDGRLVLLLWWCF